MSCGDGCRIGEIIGLQWEDLDFDERIISINHNMAYLAREEESAYYKVELPKTDSGIRTIPMLDEVAEIFQLTRAETESLIRSPFLHNFAGREHLETADRWIEKGMMRP